MLDASPRVVAAAGSGLIDLHAPRVVEHADGTTTRAHARSCGKANHASLTWICDVEQLYTDAALMLDASPRVVAAAGSGLIDMRPLPVHRAPSIFPFSRLFCRPFL